MIIYSPHITSRVRYMADWLGNYLFNTPLQVKQTNEWNENEPVLNYSNVDLPGTYKIKPQGLLFETGIIPQLMLVRTEDEFPVFFETAGTHSFDLLSAVFYLISRYEEYLPHKKDEYGRYAHVNGIAFQNDFLQRPLVDEWMLDLKERFATFYPSIEFAERTFSFIPTYDVDMAWSYREKELWRNTGGLVKQIFSGEWSAAATRIKILAGKSKDPFDVFDELDDLHAKHSLKPIWFFLLAKQNKGYDKNISPFSMPFRSLIKQLAAKYLTGIHLSWQAWQDMTCMKEEKKLLEEIIGEIVTANRMHFIKFDLPGTFQQLHDELGIIKEYSMGYGSINGFRASTCTPFYWYDLARETATSLQIFPFAYMEANSIFEQKDTPEKALAEMEEYHDSVKKVGGIFISIFHNHLIGRDAEGRKWWKMYEMFLERNCEG